MGQNFLRDPNIAKRQVLLAGIEPGERVLEIGGGHGILTKMLAETGADVTCIEKDPGLAAELCLAAPSVNIIEADALDIRWPDFDRFVANIPYSISTDLTLKLLGCDFQRAVVMYQEEFARRLAATTGSGDWSRLGVRAGYRHELSIAFKVSRNSFYPPPKVDSAVVVIEPVEPMVDVLDENIFFALVNILFSHRRKKARNNLISGLHVLSRKSGVDENRIEDMVRVWDMGDERIETISMEDIADLSNIISGMGGQGD